jgi:Ca-activated chloride channel family protein
MNAFRENFHFRGRVGRRLCLVLPLFALVLPASAPGQDGISPGAATISVDVSLVELHAAVRDKNGFVAGLGKEDFHVFEDGIPQTIRLFRHEDVPVTVGLIVDNSSSMRKKRPDVTAAALAFVRSSNPRDEMFIVNFNERVSLGLPPEHLFSASAAELESALNVPAGGMTALYDAIEDGLAHLKKAGREKKILIVVSDGGDNASRHHLSQVLRDAERSDAIVYTIGLFDEYDSDRNPGVLKRIARVTGGEAFLPNVSIEVVPICERIAADIRHQYTIGYTPSNGKLDGTYRRIKVTATRLRGGRLFVRTRSGYIASSGSNAAPSESRENRR